MNEELCRLIDADDAEALATLLRQRPELRDAYVDLMLLHGHLCGELRVTDAPALRLSGHTKKPTHAAARLPGAARAAAIAAGLLIAATLGYLAWSSGSKGDPPPAPPAPVATLIAADGAEWGDTPRYEGEQIKPGPLDLAAGSIELLFDSGVTARLFGPARFDLTGTMSATLRFGRIEVAVPERARGFSIDTPGGARVTDLGTEFGVDVDPDGIGRVYVFDGVVEVRSGSRLVTVTAGEGARVDRDGTLTHVRAGLTPAGIPVTVYREPFGNAHDTDRPLAEAGWSVHKGPLGEPAQKPVLSYAGSKSGEPIASSPPAATRTDAFMLTLDEQSGVDYLYWTDELTIDGDRWRPTRMSWTERHDVSAQTTRAAIRIGTRWFLSEPLANDPVTGMRARSVSLASVAWNTLRFEPGRELAIGDPIATLPTGDVTALGVYVERRVGFKLRFDSVQLDAVPVRWWSPNPRSPSADPPREPANDDPEEGAAR